LLRGLSTWSRPQLPQTGKKWSDLFSPWTPGARHIAGVSIIPLFMSFSRGHSLVAGPHAIFLGYLATDIGVEPAGQLPGPKQLRNSLNLWSVLVN